MPEQQFPGSGGPRGAGDPLGDPPPAVPPAQPGEPADPPQRSGVGALPWIVGAILLAVVVVAGLAVAAFLGAFDDSPRADPAAVGGAEESTVVSTVTTEPRESTTRKDEGGDRDEPEGREDADSDRHPDRDSESRESDRPQRTTRQRQEPAHLPDPEPPAPTNWEGWHVDRACLTSMVGTSVTSCDFADNVAGDVMAGNERRERFSVTSYSPATGRSYRMNCELGARHVGGPTDTYRCIGGDNAVVYVPVAS